MARYDAFLLRVWRSEGKDCDQWACRMEHLPDGLSQRFADLDALLAHLGTALRHGNEERRGTGSDVPTDEKGAY